MDCVAAESQVDAIKAAKCLHITAIKHNSHKKIFAILKEIYLEKVFGLFFFFFYIN